MSELSESEKRQLLRERRKQKFSNGAGSTRLSKITGQQSGSFLPTESPLDRPKSSGSSAGDLNIQDKDDFFAEISKSAGSGISDKGKEGNPEVALLEQLMNMRGGPEKPGAGGNGIDDIFSSLFRQGAQPGPEAAGVPSADMVSVSMHTHRAKQLKAYTILIRWAVLFPLVYFAMTPPSNIIGEYIHSLLQRFSFFMMFSTFEIVTISMYYQALLRLEKINKVNTMNNTSKLVTWANLIPEGILPVSNIPGKLTIIMYYWDVFSMCLTDLSFCIVAVGVISYYHSFV
ncbi:HCL187Wp [Eremothecium sinecaudum]|uniref:Golgi to ER traffic protein 2 n=1 Tax=Eremothecium sinecaudum TaxID=45286 RepID=A0A0X8HR83_9SACH|nr:HCL187Wp [Eremothecium sinecaudum]AMD19964.1 HCL187Wp [Eremothecium sinecaudum]